MPKIKKLTKESPEAAEQYKALMERFKIENPVKYEKATTEKTFVNNTMTEYEYKLKMYGGKPESK